MGPEHFTDVIDAHIVSETPLTVFDLTKNEADVLEAQLRIEQAELPDGWARDRIVERRTEGHVWISMGQGLGTTFGLRPIDFNWEFVGPSLMKKQSFSRKRDRSAENGEDEGIPSDSSKEMSADKSSPRPLDIEALNTAILLDDDPSVILDDDLLRSQQSSDNAVEIISVSRRRVSLVDLSSPVFRVRSKESDLWDLSSPPRENHHSMRGDISHTLLEGGDNARGAPTAEEGSANAAESSTPEGGANNARGTGSARNNEANVGTHVTALQHQVPMDVESAEFFCENRMESAVVTALTSSPRVVDTSRVISGVSSTPGASQGSMELSAVTGTVAPAVSTVIGAGAQRVVSSDALAPSVLLRKEISLLSESSDSRQCHHSPRSRIGSRGGPRMMGEDVCEDVPLAPVRQVISLLSQAPTTATIGAIASSVTNVRALEEYPRSGLCADEETSSEAVARPLSTMMADSWPRQCGAISILSQDDSPSSSVESRENARQDGINEAEGRIACMPTVESRENARQDGINEAGGQTACMAPRAQANGGNDATVADAASAEKSTISILTQL
eukprot:GEMP01041378.1.p1 GENE.GEMP01041378.1~~GEMP01041378.1.p1  ORF type:complete len:561 (-),score=125.23 GEMP01041378.1:110-1792(-)